MKELVHDNHNIDRAKRKMVEAKIRPIPGYVLLNFNWFLATNALFRRALLEDVPAALIKIPSACSPGLNFAVPLVGIPRWEGRHEGHYRSAARSLPDASGLVRDGFEKVVARLKRATS